MIVLAVHLCGTLSLRAVDMFNENPNVVFLALKPCCLPPMVHADREEAFEIGRHRFEAAEVCAAGRFKKNRWYGPPRWHLENRFRLWAKHLFLGVDVGDGEGGDQEEDGGRISGEEGRKVRLDVDVQVKGGFQNAFILAQRRPLTGGLWTDLETVKARSEQKLLNK